MSSTPATERPFIPFKTFAGAAPGVVDVDAQVGLESTVVALGGSGPVPLPDQRGTAFGFVSSGAVMVETRDGLDYIVGAGEWFVEPSARSITARTAHGASIKVAGYAVFRHEYKGLRARGGPVEHAGRLRYIDGCTDTLLFCPVVVGDACINLLHFPAGINQTQHTHPSARIGMVYKGRGYCIDGHGDRTELEPGLVFNIPAGCVHSFFTEDESMDVIAYHPDSDWGPGHGDGITHPMLSRTWVDDAPIDNQVDKHKPIDIIDGFTGVY